LYVVIIIIIIIIIMFVKYLEMQTAGPIRYVSRTYYKTFGWSPCL